MTSRIIDHVAKCIREFRTSYGGGAGISQDALAKALGVASNTISRWETATYRPTLEDLENLARFFGKSVADFLPSDREQSARDEQIDGLLRTAKQLEDSDVEELRRYAEFRRSQRTYARVAGRKPKR